MPSISREKKIENAILAIYRDTPGTLERSRAQVSRFKIGIFFISMFLTIALMLKLPSWITVSLSFVTGFLLARGSLHSANLATLPHLVRLTVLREKE